MSIYHPSPILDSGGNITFIPSSSNNTDKSLLSINWNTDIINKPSFCNISFTANYNDLSNTPDLSIYATSNLLSSTSNSLFSSLSNIDNSSSNSIFSFTNLKLNSLVSSQWTTSSSSNIHLSLSGNVGIGSSLPSYKLDVSGSINSSNYLIQQQNISNIFISSNVFDNTSNILYSTLSNQDFISSSIKITSSQWSNANNNIDIFYNVGNIGIGTSLPSYNLDVSGNINSSHYLINQTNISNIFTTSNIVDYKSNICIAYVDTKVANLVSSQWATSNNNIYLNKSGNVGIGSSIPLEKLDIIGNLLISGDIYPSQSSNYDLGSSTYKWRDLYLSGNSIYLDNMVVFKNGNSLEIKDSNLNAGHMGININQISISSNNQLSHIRLDANGTILIHSNGTNKFPVNLNNKFDYSNIIYSNTLLQQSNNLYSFTNTSMNSINTDTIPIGSSNRFITNDIYNRNLTINGILSTSNLITSNLSVIGDSTTLNTSVYQTEQLQIVNDTTATSLIVRQVNTENNVAEFYFNNTNLGLVIHKSGNIQI